MSVLDGWRTALDRARADTASAADARRRAALGETRNPMGGVLLAASAAAGGALAAYLLDPDRGRSRRAQLSDRMRSGLHTSRRRADRLVRGIRANADAMAARSSAAMRERPPLDENDATLTERVESELFRDPAIPKGDLNINAEHGIVVVRGELPDEATRERIETAIRRIPGVWEVKNLTHLRGEPAPTAR